MYSNSRIVASLNWSIMNLMVLLLLILHFAICLFCVSDYLFNLWHELYSIRFFYQLPSSHSIKEDLDPSRGHVKERGLLEVAPGFGVFCFTHLIQDYPPTWPNKIFLTPLSDWVIWHVQFWKKMTRNTFL